MAGVASTKELSSYRSGFFLSLCVMIFVDPAFVFCFVLLAFCSIHEYFYTLVVYMGSLQFALFGIDRSLSIHFVLNSGQQLSGSKRYFWITCNKHRNFLK